MREELKETGREGMVEPEREPPAAPVPEPGYRDACRRYARLAGRRR